MASITIKTLLWASSSALALGLAGCGGDTSFIDKQNGSGSGSGAGSTDNSALIAARAGFDDLIASLQVEGGYLFGDYDATDPATQKGVLDHGVDTLSQGMLQLAIEVKSSFESLPVTTAPANRGDFIYRQNCFAGLGDAINVGCYVVTGEALKNVLPSLYDTWDFEISKADLRGLRLTAEQLDQYAGRTSVFILENVNPDKNLNDVWVSGSFSYPYQQTWNLNQIEQKRFVTINAEGSEESVQNNALFDEDLIVRVNGVEIPTTSFDTTVNFQDNQGIAFGGGLNQNDEVAVFNRVSGESIATTNAAANGDFTVTFSEGLTDKGVFTVYDDPTSTNGDFYNLGNAVDVSVLLNDNPNRPEAEVVNFSLTSTPGDAASSSSYRVRTDGIKVLDLRNLVSLEGQRVENEEPDLNASAFTGSINLRANDIYQFSLPQNDGDALVFDYTLNGIRFTGTSTNTNGVISTTATTLTNGVPYTKTFNP